MVGERAVIPPVAASGPGRLLSAATVSFPPGQTSNEAAALLPVRQCSAPIRPRRSARPRPGVGVNLRERTAETASRESTRNKRTSADVTLHQPSAIEYSPVSSLVFVCATGPVNFQGLHDV